MIGFKEFLTEASKPYSGLAGKAGTPQQVSNRLLKECQDAIVQVSKGNILYRGVMQAKENENFTFIYASEINRRSIQTKGEHYTDLLNALPSWQEFNRIAPRTQAIVGSTAFTKAKDYADKGQSLPYVLFPANGTEILVCPDSDIKTSFTELRKFGAKEFSKNLDTASFSHEIGSVLKIVFGDGSASKDVYIKNLKSITDDSLTDGNRNNHFDSKQITLLKPYQRMIQNTNSDNLFEALDKIFDPIKNGFDKIALTSKYPRDCEIWFRANCGAVRMQHEATPELLEFCKITKLDVKHFIL